MEKYKIAFEIEGLPKTRNQLNRRHWSEYSKEGKKWKLLVACKVGVNRPPQPLKRAKIKLTRFSSRQCDFDGLVGSFKWVIDALVHYQVIQDDSPNVIGQPEFYWSKTKPKQGKILVEVQELE